jgi:hypothetical protein
LWECERGAGRRAHRRSTTDRSASEAPSKARDTWAARLSFTNEGILAELEGVRPATPTHVALTGYSDDEHFRDFPGRLLARCRVVPLCVVEVLMLGKFADRQMALLRRMHTVALEHGRCATEIDALLRTVAVMLPASLPCSWRPSLLRPSRTHCCSCCRQPEANNNTHPSMKELKSTGSSNEDKEEMEQDGSSNGSSESTISDVVDPADGSTADDLEAEVRTDTLEQQRRRARRSSS